MAMFFLSFDELGEKERPPKKIWLDSEALHDWFEMVKRNREREAKGDQIMEGEPVQNQAASALISG